MSKIIVIILVKRHYTKKDTKQKQHMAYMESTYLLKKRVTPLDLAIINNPDLFTHSKVERSYNNGVQHAKEDLNLLDFFLTNLRPKYRTQITNSSEFHNVIKSLLDLSVVKWHKMSKEEMENYNAFAIQLLSYSLNVIVRTMPPEFLKPVKDASIPLNNLLKSIYNYSKNNNLKDLPSFKEIDFPITERD